MIPPLSAGAPPPLRARPSKDGDRFYLPLPEATADAPEVPAPAAADWAGLLSLQEYAGRETERKAAAHVAILLGKLLRLQHLLLTDQTDAAALDELAAMVDVGFGPLDPRLAALISEVRIRIKTELAKRGR